MSKPHPERVSPELLTEANKIAHRDRQAAFSQYIVLMFRATGKLGPQCDARDFYALYDEMNARGELARP